MIQIVFGDIPGFNQSKNGATYRNVCSEDMRLVEPTNITPSQISSASQYLRERCISVVATVLSWLARFGAVVQEDSEFSDDGDQADFEWFVALMQLLITMAQDWG